MGKFLEFLKEQKAGESRKILVESEEAQRYLLNLPLGEVKVESEEYGSDNVNSMRLIKVSDNEFVFICP